MNFKKINGIEVIDTDGYSVGKVDDLDVDMGKGLINYVIVKSGFSTRHIINLDKIMSIGDKMILKIRKDELGKK